jgi:hypothetical protein
MVNQGRVLKTEKISEVNHPTGLARGMLLVETQQVVIGRQLQTEAEETWRQAVIRPVGTLVVAGAIQCSPGSQAPLMVWIEVGKTPKCRVIAEVPVARACRHLPVAAEVVEAEDSPAEVAALVAAEVVEAPEVAAVVVAVAAEVAAVAGDSL